MERLMEVHEQPKFEDETLNCIDCGRQFTFEANEQLFFWQKGLAKPKRCPDCRRQRKATIVPERGRW
jgi:NAD-dependent SIR2 family protein deacetylase